MGKRIVIGISGASGIILAHKTIVAFAERGFDIDLVMSTGALYTAAYELGTEYRTAKRFLEQLPVHENVRLHSIHDIGSAICSGSYPVCGMIIVPCSMATLAAIAHGISDNCLRRAADVTLKEKRPLIIVPRETPLSTIHLENMLKLSQLNASIVMPVPAWYTEPHSLECVENFIVGKILDSFKLPHNFYPAWKMQPTLDYEDAH